MSPSSRKRKLHDYRYDRALPLYESAVNITEKILGFDDLNPKVVQETLRSLWEKLEI